MRWVERARMAWAAWNHPVSATWYVVEDLQPLGWHIMHEETSYDRAAEWLADTQPSGNRTRVLRADLWEARTVALMRNRDTWLRLGDMARKANRWQEHQREVELLTVARGAGRDPERITGGIPIQSTPPPPLLPQQHGTGWPVDAPTTPVPGLSVENDPEHVGTRLERAMRRGRHVALEANQGTENVGPEWDTGPHDNNAATG